MSFSNIFRKVCSIFDIYSSPFVILFQHKSSYRTSFGGIISLIGYLILLAIIIYLFFLGEKKEEQNITTFDLRNDVFHNITFKSNIDYVHFAKEINMTGFFLPAIAIISKDQNSQVELSEIETVIQFEARGNTRINNAIEHVNINYKKCTEIGPNIADILKNNYYKKAICLTNDEIVIGGDFFDPVYQFLSLRINYTTPQDAGTNNNYQILVLTTEPYIDQEVLSGAPVKYITKTIQVDILPKNRQSFDGYVSPNELVDLDNVYANWRNKKQRMLSYNRQFKRLRVLETNSKTVLDFNFRTDVYYKQYLRRYKSFFEFLSEIGGLWRVLVLIGTVLVVTLNMKLMNVSISNQMFNMINPTTQKEKNINKTYEEGGNDFNKYNRVAPIYQSVNPVGVRMLLSYYKYERNRGMEFTGKEALRSVLCCCFKNKEIEAKDRIFEESKEEILRDLNGSTIAEFAFKSKAMNSILLPNESIGFKYRVSNTISWSKLWKIENSNGKHNKLKTSSSMAGTNYKQEFFIGGMNTLRNQGDLGKIDLMIINLFNINPELVKTFFGAYNDRGAEIYPEEKEIKQVVKNA